MPLGSLIDFNHPVIRKALPLLLRDKTTGRNMKSGMYIAEIVKRLFRSSRMQTLYPDDARRLKHIFEKQVYGLAPTEIIYRIALAYVLGFAEDLKIEKNNLRKFDALPAAKAGTLETELDRLFGGDTKSNSSDGCSRER